MERNAGSVRQQGLGMASCVDHNQRTDHSVDTVAESLQNVNIIGATAQGTPIPPPPPPPPPSSTTTMPLPPPPPPRRNLTGRRQSDASSGSSMSATSLPEGTVRKPILIVPGFMSSALKVEASNVVQRWENKRIWMSLQRLGFTGKVLGTTSLFETNDEDVEQIKMKNDWLLHLTLQPDLLSERDGISVRAIEGLHGVDFLEPGLFLNAQTYVFGPLIKTLVKKGGYTRDKDLDAMSYDWRMPPGVLEERDQYFTRSLERIERMYHENDQQRVVLLCHSMGCQMAEYMLQFALRNRGRSWIDKYVDTYIPIGGPHLGSPSALASVVRGSNMGLPRTFLSTHAALILGRSLGSTPLLLPVHPDGCIESQPEASACIFAPIVKQTGMLRIKVDNLDLRVLASFYRNLGQLRLRIKFASTTLNTPWYEAHPILLVEPVHGETGALMFEMEAPIRLGQGDDFLTLEIVEQVLAPDITARRLLGHPIVEHLPKAPSLGSKVREAVYNSTLGTLRAIDPGHVICRSEFRLADILTAKYVPNTPTVMCFPISCASSSRSRKGCNAAAQMEITWLPPELLHQLAHAQMSQSPSFVTTSEIRDAKHKKGMNPESSQYMRYTPVDLLKIEGLHDTVRLWESYFYQQDPCIKTSAPPVSNVFAIYGTNIKTMITCVYKRQSKQVCSTILSNDYAVDTSAQIDHAFAKSLGVKMEKGVIYETYRTPQPDGRTISGDGTVPYQTLAHVQTWKDKCNVRVEEITGEEHRAILRSQKLHQILLDYLVTVPTGYSAPLAE
nr:putative phospholipid:diacylglycerol acyltransferase [Aurantiochytrium sp. SD116]